MEKLISVIIPAFNEEPMIEKAYGAIHTVLDEKNIPFELIFIDDGSKDETWKMIKKCALKDTAVIGVRFSRNFGKESAISAGLRKAKGACCVVIDCDLQHPPEKIVEMYEMWQQGYEIVEARKANRGKESPIHTFFTKIFYGLMSNATKVDMRHASDFKLLDRKVIDALNRFDEANPFFRALSSWVGFKCGTVEFEVQERTAGTTKWSTKSLILYAINNVVCFTAAPLKLVTFMGGGLVFISVILSIEAIIQKIRGTAAVGFTTVIILLCLIGGIIMISLGIIGMYIEKIFDEVKNRPIYIVSQEVNGGSEREN